MSDKIREKIADQLKLHETQIVNVGAHDEEEAKRRRQVRYETADSILSLETPTLRITVVYRNWKSPTGYVKEVK